MGKAKTASKNNPTSRKQARKFFLDGVEIKPAKFISANGSLMVAEREDGTVVFDHNNKPMPWAQASRRS